MMNSADIPRIAEQLRQCGMQAIEIQSAGTRLRIVTRQGAPGEAAAAAEQSPPLPGEATTLVRSNGLGVLRLRHPAQPHVPLAVGMPLEQGAPAVYLESRGLFKSVVAPVGGEVAELLVAEGDKVDFGRPLFTLRGAAQS
ncbi:biotin/lipoyl-containing protein [Pantoea sp. 18069]|uniref:biotin/lipoyl-containing protein n=1 Tax=Pantoea sp. 18069 TaxID=2681415 RepID=UPI00135B8B73|nr:biotin/lipoyl-containing protein [Pantoea sp. 18069]